MILKLFSIVAVVAFATGCNDNTSRRTSATPNHTIKGQVFIIQKNRINLKLGGVEVNYVELSEYRKRCEWIGSERSRAIEVKQYENELRHIDSWLKEVGYAPSASKLHPFLNGALHLQETAQSRFRSNPEVAEFERIEESRISHSELLEHSGISDNETHQWNAACLFYDWMDRNADHKAKTDGDGNFTMTIPKSAPGVLMMTSSRQLAGSDFESYYWLKEIEGDEVDPIIFSSNDAVTGEFLTGIVRQASEPKPSSQKLIQVEMNLVDLGWFSAAQPIFTSILGGDQQLSTLQSQLSQLKESIQEIKNAPEP